MNSKSLSLLSLVLAIFLFACKKESPVGSTLISNDSKFYGTLVDTLTVEAYTEADTAIPTENRSRVVIGELNDTEFGITKAQWFSQFLMTGGIVPGTNAQLDSIVLTFHVDTIYGPTNTTTFRVYELTGDFATGEYYSNKSIAYGAEIANSTLTIDSGTVHIALPNAIGQKILAAKGDTLTSNNSFMHLFKGLSIKVEQASLNSDQGALYVINPSHANTKVSLYYTNTSSSGQQKADLTITSSARHFSNFSHDFSGTVDLKDQINNSTQGLNRLFLKPLAGTHIAIKFPTVLSWAKDKNYIIQRAELVLPVESGSYDTYRIPSSMSLLLNDNGTLKTFDDMTQFTNYNLPSPSTEVLVNGILKPIKNGGRLETDKYRFMLTKFISDDITNNTSSTLILNSIGNSISPYRTIFAGTNKNNPTHIKLLVYYTK